MTTFKFNFSAIKSAADEIVGDAVTAKNDANVLRNAASSLSNKATQAEKDAQMHFDSSVAWTEKAKQTYRAFADALDQSKNELKEQLHVASKINDGGIRKQALLNSIEDILWSQVVDSLGDEFANDLDAMRQFENGKVTPIDLMNFYVKSNKEASNTLFEAAREMRDESNRMFTKADSILYDAGLGSIVDDGKAYSRAKKDLEKSVKVYKK